jgi:hypothetical protein
VMTPMTRDWMPTTPPMTPTRWVRPSDPRPWRRQDEGMDADDAADDAVRDYDMTDEERRMFRTLSSWRQFITITCLLPFQCYNVFPTLIPWHLLPTEYRNSFIAYFIEYLILFNSIDRIILLLFVYPKIYVLLPHVRRIAQRTGCCRSLASLCMGMACHDKFS